MSLSPCSVLCGMFTDLSRSFPNEKTMKTGFLGSSYPFIARGILNISLFFTQVTWEIAGVTTG